MGQRNGGNGSGNGIPKWAENMLIRLEASIERHDASLKNRKEEAKHHELMLKDHAEQLKDHAAQLKDHQKWQRESALWTKVLERTHIRTVNALDRIEKRLERLERGDR